MLHSEIIIHTYINIYIYNIHIHVCNSASKFSKFTFYVTTHRHILDCFCVCVCVCVCVYTSPHQWICVYKKSNRGLHSHVSIPRLLRISGTIIKQVNIHGFIGVFLFVAIKNSIHQLIEKLSEWKFVCKLPVQEICRISRNCDKFRKLKSANGKLRELASKKIKHAQSWKVVELRASVSRARVTYLVRIFDR